MEPTRYADTEAASGPVGGPGVSATSRSDIVLISRALRRGWSIPLSLLKVLPDEITRVVCERDRDGNFKFGTRARLSACRLLLQMEAQEIQRAAITKEIEQELLKAQGTVLTPDQDARDMDATIPRATDRGEAQAEPTADSHQLLSSEPQS